MSDVAEKLARRRQCHNAAMVALLVPAALLAGCAPVAFPPPSPQPAFLSGPAAASASGSGSGGPRLPTARVRRKEPITNYRPMT